jgi:hypothetical protein
VRQIDLGFDFLFAAQWARGLSSRSLRFGGAADVGSHFFRFMLLERTGMGLLLGHPNVRKRVENSFAFDFQFPGEIVDSNLTHPAFLFPALWLSLHCSLTESALCNRTPSKFPERAMLFSCFGSRTFRLMLFIF